MVQKFYCFVDETGQDTEGKLFLVAVVLKENTQLDILEEKLLQAEARTGKRKLKWKKTRSTVKRAYLDELLQIKELQVALYYSIYEATKEYSKLTSLTIAKAILAKKQKDYTVTIIIDGLNDKERDVVREELKKLDIRYRKIRGMKDEQSVFLRLADAMAGFLREAYEKEAYTAGYIGRFTGAKIVTET